MKILIAGSRSFDDRKLLFRECDKVLYRQPWDTADLRRHVQAIMGDARGADTMAAEWAYERWLTYQIFHADWDQYGQSAGAVRNREMVLAALADHGGCEAVIFMAKGGTPGTKITLDLCRAKGIKVHLVEF